MGSSYIFEYLVQLFAEVICHNSNHVLKLLVIGNWIISNLLPFFYMLPTCIIKYWKLITKFRILKQADFTTRQDGVVKPFF